ncbi:spinster family MFS transporter [Caulobacter mirabilis]|uniref:MFS transporter n=1 Tax=Caulobacter mirabilis TaxID=69666 RepID=A0A2D2AVM4_9CAUL|nr:MFS transporter [Caulobacter mirabilis]ATQ42060.1 MFS transporter [Caulobacter mirabilis]
MTDTAAAAEPQARPLYSNGYKATVLGMLLAAYTFNFIDRTIIATIGQAIKVDLKLTDTQLGLLGGLYFALLYTTLGIPIARWAERGNRTTIIALALVIWSGFTALCGAAQNFVQLALLRFGVGIGEAGCSPPAHSLISDYFEPKKRATALSIYSFGIPLGTMIGAVAGGWLATEFSWRVAFVIVGLPGVILALLFKILVKEPPRGHSEAIEKPLIEEDLTAPAPPAPKPFSLGQEFRELGAVAKVLFAKWPVVHMVLGITLASFAGYGTGAFVPPYFVRQFGLDLATVGLIVGLVGGFSAGIGTLVGGIISDWAGKKSTVWYTLTPAFGLAIAMPIYIWAYLLNDWKMAALILLVPGIFHYTYLGPTFGVVQNSVPVHRRATATALLFFFLNLIALGGGPVFTGWLIDHFAQFNFNNPGQGVMGLLGAFGGGEAAASFTKACPGGVAPAGAAESLKALCHDSSALATRQGIVVTLLFYGWAAIHYFLAAIGLARHMKEAQAS